MRTAISFCRICSGNCGTLLTIDEDDRIASIRGDREHPLSQGYACSKGLEAGEMHRRPDRLLHPLKRGRDGSFERIDPDRALDEIAARMEAIIERDGPVAVASFFGTGGYNNAAVTEVLPAFMRAIESPSFFSAVTIDQSCMLVTAARMGAWHAGRQPWSTADVWMLFGTNPLVSLAASGGAPAFNPSKGFREARERGLKLVVVDPRRTETARYADLHLQIRPGGDAALAAGLLRMLLARGLEDRAFCDAHIHGLERLRAGVERFTPEHVERLAGIPARELEAAAELFAAGPRGCAGAATGVSMSPFSNVTHHLIECLNVVCGRYLREGEAIADPLVLTPREERRAEVVPPSRTWETGHKLRVRELGGLQSQMGHEMPSGALADEILLPGEGQIRALIVQGGNPATAIPDQRKITKALASLELLVSVEPFMGVTARMSHYVLPPTLMYERADFPLWFGLSRRQPCAFANYAEPVVAPPPGAQVLDDWYVYWALAKRMGRTLEIAGEPLEMDAAPSTEDVLRRMARGGEISVDDLRRHPHGRVFDVEPQLVQPAARGHAGRFDVLPDDVADELAAYEAAAGTPSPFGHRLTVRRMRHAINSYRPQAEASTSRGRRTYNPAYMSPEDLAALGLVDGDRVRLVSDAGEIVAVVAADPGVRPGVVSMAHGWGAGPEDDRAAEEAGSCTNLIISTDRDCEAVNAMPRMSAVPVTVVPAGDGSALGNFS